MLQSDPSGIVQLLKLTHLHTLKQPILIDLDLSSDQPPRLLHNMPRSLVCQLDLLAFALELMRLIQEFCRRGTFLSAYIQVLPHTL